MFEDLLHSLSLCSSSLRFKLEITYLQCTQWQHIPTVLNDSAKHSGVLFQRQEYYSNFVNRAFVLSNLGIAFALIYVNCLMLSAVTEKKHYLLILLYNYYHYYYYHYHYYYYQYHHHHHDFGKAVVC